MILREVIILKKINPNVKIFDGAHVIGDVDIAENVSIWYNAVVRGDNEPISIGKDSNVQDNCVLHTSPKYPVKIGENVSVGHAAVLHGCEIDDDVLIGMNATLLNGSHISKNSIVGAGALVTENKNFPEGSLIIGVPAKAVRQLNHDEIKHIKDNAKKYVNLSKKE